MNKAEMKMKQFIFLCAAILLLASCASEDNANQSNKSQQDTTNVPTVTFVGYQPETTASAKTRTTATHERGKAAKVFWEPTDRIWVKNDQGTFRQSDPATFPTASNKAQANFKLRTSYWDGYYKKFNPEVRYVGTSNNVNSVRIANQQTQTNPNDFSHLGAAGDCGTATAQGGGGDHQFTLEHKASYLCFVPRCTNASIGANLKVTKITVTADKDIAGDYNFSDGTLIGKTPSNASKTITLNLGSASPFTLNTTTENLSVNGAYMVLAPGTYNLTIDYEVKDNSNNAISFTKTLSGFTCAEGKIRDVTANLTPKEIGSEIYNSYWAWDAQYPYTDSRSIALAGHGANWFPLEATTPFFKTLPNINEALYYVKNGDPHWVSSGGGVYVNEGRLVTVGGLWLKKKSVILAELKASGKVPTTFTEADMKEHYMGQGYVADYRSSTQEGWEFPVQTGVPSNIEDYFFLPAFGHCGWTSNKPEEFGYQCYYWVSSKWNYGVLAGPAGVVYMFAYSISCGRNSEYTTTPPVSGRIHWINEGEGYCAVPFQ